MFKRTLCVLSCAAAMTTAMVGCAPLVVGSVAVATVSTVSTINDRRSAGSVVNDGVTLVFNDRTGERAEKIEYFYEHGIQDYANEIAGEGTLTPVARCC